MDAGWGTEFLRRFAKAEGDTPIATVLTRDNREFLCRQDEIEVLETFPTAWICNGTDVIPESEIVRVEVSGARLIDDD